MITEALKRKHGYAFDESYNREHVLPDGTIIPEKMEREWHGPELSAAEIDAAVAEYTSWIAANLIKGEAARRILERCPDWKQRNMTARGVELQDIWRLGGTWTTEETAEFDNLKAVWSWIIEVRTASDELEVSLPDNFTADVHWP